MIDENKEKLTHVEKRNLIKELLKAYSYREVVEKTGIPKTTLHHWVNGRKEQGRQFSINYLIKYFDGYKPKLAEFQQIQQLIKTLEKVINI